MDHYTGGDVWWPNMPSDRVVKQMHKDEPSIDSGQRGEPDLKIKCANCGTVFSPGSGGDSSRKLRILGPPICDKCRRDYFPCNCPGCVESRKQGEPVEKVPSYRCPVCFSVLATGACVREVRENTQTQIGLLCGNRISSLEAENKKLKEEHAECMHILQTELDRYKNPKDTLCGLVVCAVNGIFWRGQEIQALKFESAELQRAHDKNLEAGLKLVTKNAKLTEEYNDLYKQTEFIQHGKTAELIAENARLKEDNDKLEHMFFGEHDDRTRMDREITALRARLERVSEFAAAIAKEILPVTYPSSGPPDGGEPGEKKTASETVADSGRTLWHCGVCDETAPGCKCDRDVLAERDEGKPVKTAGEEKVVCGEEEVPIDEIIEGSAELPVKDTGSAPTLAPCPMPGCGSAKIAIDAAMPCIGDDDIPPYWVVCRTCGMRGPKKETEALAASAWGELAGKKYTEEDITLVQDFGWTTKKMRADHALAERVRELWKKDHWFTTTHFGEMVNELMLELYPPEADREGEEDA